MQTQRHVSVPPGEREKTLFIRDQQEVTIVCPLCHKSRSISVSRFAGRKHCLKVRCSCTTCFTVNLDFRKFYRKPTDLQGYYNSQEQPRSEGAARIRDLSVNGVCIETLGNHSMRIGQTGSIDFTLDNKKASRVKKVFLIRAINGNILRCEFVNDRAYDKDLGFYLTQGN